MNEPRVLIDIVGLNEEADSKREAVRLGVADVAIGDYVIARSLEPLHIVPMPIEKVSCPYCHGLLVAKYGRRVGRIAERRGVQCIAELMPSSHMYLYCEDCQHSFTCLECAEIPV